MPETKGLTLEEIQRQFEIIRAAQSAQEMPLLSEEGGPRPYDTV